MRLQKRRCPKEGLSYSSAADPLRAGLCPSSQAPPCSSYSARTSMTVSPQPHSQMKPYSWPSAEAPATATAVTRSWLLNAFAASGVCGTTLRVCIHLQAERRLALRTRRPCSARAVRPDGSTGFTAGCGYCRMGSYVCGEASALPSPPGTGAQCLRIPLVETSLQTKSRACDLRTRRIYGFQQTRSSRPGSSMVPPAGGSHSDSGTAAGSNSSGFAQTKRASR